MNVFAWRIDPYGINNENILKKPIPMLLSEMEFVIHIPDFLIFKRQY